MKIFVFGRSGKMGKEITSILKEEDIVASLSNADVAIDFSDASVFQSNLAKCTKHKIPLIVGTTALSDSDQQAAKEGAKAIPLMIIPNFSKGAKELEMITKKLAPHARKVTIREVHHTEKRDSPSGTALKLAQIIEELSPLKAEITSVREGDEIGTHQIVFEFPGETLSIQHAVQTREAFAVGAVRCAKWIAKKEAGEYNYPL